MTVIDLSQTISTEMPVYPGTEGPRIEAANTIEREGFAEKLLSFYSHTGTHIDAPAHMLPGRPCLDNFDAGKFFGRACLIDLSGHPGGTIAEAAIEAHEARIAACDFVLLRT
ncbi:MAG: cyclase family protein, partial [Thermoleophilia bacterium]